MKKFLIYLGVVVLLLGLIAGCSSSEPADSGQSQGSSGDSGGSGDSSSGGDAKKEDNKSDFPTKPITVIVPWGAGGGSDQMTRAMVKSAEAETDVQFVVKNMPGAAGLTGLNFAMNQPNDGYTIYEGITTQIVQMATGQTEYMIGEDLVPIASTQQAISFLYINSKEDRFANFDELMEYMKAGNEIKIAVLSDNGFDAALLAGVEAKYGVEFNMIPFNNPSERYAALQGGHVDVLFEQIGDVRNFVDSGVYKPIFAYNGETIKAYPDVPVSVDKGVDITIPYLRGFWYKKGAPQEAVDYVAEVIKKAMETEEWKKFEKQQMTDLKPSYSKGEEYNKLLMDQLNYFKENIK